MKRKEEIIVGLDIGTTKVCAIVGEVDSNGGIDIIGFGEHPSRGLRKGVVVNIESTVASIKRAIELAENMGACEINTVYTGIAGGHIKGINSTGIVAIKGKEVMQSDINRVLDSAKAISIPMDREVIHIIPQEYIVDHHDSIKEPLGMCGVRLEARVHIVTAAVTSAQNIIKCAQKCGLNVADIVLEQLSSSEAVLTEDEKELGVALVDIGGGTSDIVIYVGGSVVHTATLGIGGNHLTNDIAMGIRTPLAEAERIKHSYGCAMSSMVDKDETIQVPGIGGRQPRTLSRKLLCEIIEPRCEEIFSLIYQEIERAECGAKLASGVVITGGASILEGIPELAEQVLGMPVRRGVPTGIGGLKDIVENPKYATGVGLVMYGYHNQHLRQFRVRDENIYSKVKRRMGQWLKEIF
jgi:cell division protein FtsA